MCVCVCMQWRLHYTLVFRHIQQRCRVDGCHNSCPTAGASRESDTDSDSELQHQSELLQLQLDTTCYSCHVLMSACASVCVCVSACVLNIAIYHANAFFNFNMPPGIIKTLQTYNMSQHTERDGERERVRERGRWGTWNPPQKN